MNIKKELDFLLLRREKIREQQLQRYINGSATRNRTTTSNANVDKLQQRIEWLRAELRAQNESPQ